MLEMYLSVPVLDLSCVGSEPKACLVQQDFFSSNCLGQVSGEELNQRKHHELLVKIREGSAYIFTCKINFSCPKVMLVAFKLLMSYTRSLWIQLWSLQHFE